MGRLEIRDVGYPPQDVRQVAPKDLARYIDAIYRLKPDRRFIYALSEIHTILGGSLEHASVRHVDEGWVISLGKDEVGRLPDFPSFADGLALARGWAGREVQAMKGRSDRSADPGEVSRLGASVWHGDNQELWRILDRVNELAKRTPQDPALMAVAGEALVALHSRNLDALDISDPVEGRALALLVLAEASSGRPASPRTLSILAFDMGYRTDALELASAVDSGDPWSLFLSRDDDSLRALAVARDPFVLELAFKSLARRGDSEGLWSLASSTGWDSPPRMELLSTAVGMYDLATAVRVNRLMLEEAFRLAVETRLPETAPRKPGLLARAFAAAKRLTGSRGGGGVESRLGELEAAVRTQAARLDGPLVDRGTWSALLRAPLYSALHAEARYYLDLLSSTPGAAAWVEKLVDPPPGVASELKRWVEDRVSTRNGTPAGADAVTRDLGTLRQIGFWPVGRLITSVRLTSKPMWSAEVRRAVRGMFDGFDTRPDVMESASYSARYMLEDLKRFERLGAASLALAPGGLNWDSRAVLLRNTRNVPLLRQLAEGPLLGREAQATALELLLGLGEEAPETVIAKLRAFLVETRTTPSVALLQTLVSVLDGQGLQVEADKVIDEWLESAGPAAGLGEAEAQVMKSARLRKAGRLAEAWQAAALAAATWKESGLVEAARVRLAQGRLDEALEIATATTERYEGDEDGFALQAEVLWTRGRPSDAAARLKAGLQGRSATAWRGTISRSFANVYVRAEAKSAEGAVQELVRSGVGNMELRSLAAGLGDAEQHQLAFLVLSCLTGSEGEWKGAPLLAYSELRKAKGRETALAWLRTKMERLDDSSFIWAFGQGEDDLLWELADETGPKPALLNLLRAAAWARGTDRSPARREKIIEFCRRLNQTEWVAVFPLYLVGEKDEDALFAAAPDPESICTAAWLVGLRKAGDGKMDEANDWLQAAVETGKPGLPPLGFAFDLMTRWCDSGYTLERIAAQHLVF